LKDKTPYEVMTGSKPNISNLQIWGQKVWVHNITGTKLDARATEGYWVGIDDESKAHRIYWPEKRSVTVERSVKFIPNEAQGVNVPLEGGHEDFEFVKQKESAEIQEFDGEAEPDIDDDEPVKWPISPEPSDERPNIDSTDEGGRGKRIRKESEYVRRIREGEGSATGLARGGTMPRGLQLVPEVNEEVASIVEAEDWAMAAEMEAVECLNPTYEEARKRSDWPKWEAAIKTELTSLEANKTWSLAKRPKNTNVIGCKWVLRIKRNAAREVEKYKARLVARGFTQIQYMASTTMKPMHLLQDCARSDSCWPSRTETNGWLTPSTSIQHI
jgi:hypothetical protein